jgi:hypothetical protein
MLTSIFAISMPGFTELILLAIVGFALLIFWIRILLEVANATFESTNMKILWLLIVIFVGVLGALIYVIAGRRTRVKK